MMVTIEQIENLSIRTYNVLKRAGINYVHDIESMSKSELMSIKGMSLWSREELEDKLGIVFD